MNYITFNEMIEVNGLLEEKGLKIEFDETKLNFFAV